VVDEPVDQRDGEHHVAEGLALLLEAEAAIGADDDRAALVAAGDQCKARLAAWCSNGM
jgi:hypothetical protein